MANIYQYTLPRSFVENPIISSPIWNNIDCSPQFHAKHLKNWQNMEKVNPHLARTFIQVQTLDYIKQHVNNKHFYRKPTLSVHFLKTPAKKKNLTVTVKNEDCLYAANKWVAAGHKVAVLNMANQFVPGGGYAKGAGAQEEDLFRRTTLSLFLKPNLYKSFGEYNALTSKDVTVFRQGRDKQYTFLAQKEQFKINVISSAAYDLRNSVIKSDSKHYLEGMKKKIESQLRAAFKIGCTHMVLSAFGCGAFQNSPEVVAKLYKDILNSTPFIHMFDEVTFAIVPNPGAKETNYQHFKQIIEKSHSEECIEKTSYLKRFVLASSLLCAPLIYYFLGLMSLVFLTVATFPFLFQKDEKKTITIDKKWMNQNKENYNLGYNSKNWLPYLKSCIQPSAYSDGYDVGLKQAKANKPNTLRF